MKKYALFLVPWAILLFSMPIDAKKCAVLVSGGISYGDYNEYDSELWYDLFLMYETLLNFGYNHNDITVCYGDGTDFATTVPRFQNRWQSEITQLTKYNFDTATVKHVIDSVGKVLATTDTFFFDHIIGHGNTRVNDCDPGHYNSISEYRFYDYDQFGYLRDSVRDDQFAAWFARIPTGVFKIVLWATCTSQGAIDDLAGTRTIALSSSGWDFDQYHLSHVYGSHSYPAADLNHYAYCFFNGQDLESTTYNGDNNNDKRLSLYELQTDITNQYPSGDGIDYPCDNGSVKTHYNQVNVSDAGNLGNTFSLLPSQWHRCMNFGTNSMRLTEVGSAQLKLTAVSSQSLSGLIFKSLSTSQGASITSGGELRSSNLYVDDATALDDDSNLSGGLVFKNLNGQAVLCIQTDGSMMLRQWNVNKYSRFQ
jgi:hypothetical protein